MFDAPFSMQSFRQATVTLLFISAPLQSCRTVESTPAPLGDSPIQVLVIGTYHMGNPGLDVVNMEAEDVTSARRQAELASLTADLAAFEPTLIAVESESDRPGFLDSRYARFDPDRDLLSERDETVQIAYRLAANAGIERVVGIDVQEGEVSFFPFDAVRAFAVKSGRSGEIDALISTLEQKGMAFKGQQADSTISELLETMNDPSSIDEEHRLFYYGMLGLGDETEQPGAALNYGWYARNALIFSRLAATVQPGDRVVVVYGAGHAYWLRHFVEETPGFELVELGDLIGG